MSTMDFVRAAQRNYSKVGDGKVQLATYVSLWFPKERDENGKWRFMSTAEYVRKKLGPEFEVEDVPLTPRKVFVKSRDMTDADTGNMKISVELPAFERFEAEIRKQLIPCDGQYVQGEIAVGVERLLMRRRRQVALADGNMYREYGP